MTAQPHGRRHTRSTSLIFLVLVFAALMLAVSDNGQFWLDECHYAATVSEDLCESPRTRVDSDHASLDTLPAAAMLPIELEPAPSLEFSPAPTPRAPRPRTVLPVTPAPLRGPPHTSV